MLMFNINLSTQLGFIILDEHTSFLYIKNNDDDDIFFSIDDVSFYTTKPNGQIYLINPNGIVVGPNGVINTQGFVGSTLDITNEEFLNGGDLNFIGDSKNKIQNFWKTKRHKRI